MVMVSAWQCPTKTNGCE